MRKTTPLKCNFLRKRRKYVKNKINKRSEFLNRKKNKVFDKTTFSNELTEKPRGYFESLLFRF